MCGKIKNLPLLLCLEIWSFSCVEGREVVKHSEQNLEHGKGNLRKFV